MRYIVLALAVLMPSTAWAQTPQNAQASLAASLASNLSMALSENEQLRAEVADLQRKLAAVKPQESTNAPPK